MIRIYQSVKDTIITVREAVGIDICIGPDEKWQLSGMHVKFVKKKLNIAATYADLKELKEKMPRNVPLVLVINGMGILMREIAADGSNIVGQLFPGSNPADFFSMPYQVRETISFAFICRKSLAEQVVYTLAKEGLLPVTVTIGLSSVAQVLSFLETSASEITSSWYKVSTRQKEVVAIAYGEQPEETGYTTVQIGGMSVKQSHVPLLGAILQVLLKPVDQLVDPTELPTALDARQEYKYFRLFRFAAWSLLIVTLGLLLINFMVFSHFFNKNKALVQQIGIMNNAAESDLVQQKEFNTTYAFFTAAGWNKETRHGYYIDRIAALAPASIQFTMLQTALREASFGSELIFEANKIQLNGISTDPTELENFSRALKNIPGVETVSMKDYLYKRELAAAVFFIQITIRI